MDIKMLAHLAADLAMACGRDDPTEAQNLLDSFSLAIEVALRHPEWAQLFIVGRRNLLPTRVSGPDAADGLVAAFSLSSVSDLGIGDDTFEDSLEI